MTSRAWWNFISAKAAAISWAAFWRSGRQYRVTAFEGEMVRGTVEETLNALLDAEADRLCNAQRYERSEARQDSRAGSYERTLHTKAGDVSLKVPKLLARRSRRPSLSATDGARARSRKP
jgi:transposase-like protein